MSFLVICILSVYFLGSISCRISYFIDNLREMLISAGRIGIIGSLLLISLLTEDK